jgi:CMP-N-acetylneuraminic acid synthetase
VTLARGGSTSIHKKNIAPLDEIPLLAYTIAAARQSEYLDRYLVSTDDDEIMEVAKRYGAEAPFVRPAELASDDATSAAALKHAVEWAEDDEGQTYDYVVELMCTNPMKTVEDIDSAISKLVEAGADSVIGVSELTDHHPIRIKRITDDQIREFGPEEDIGTRRQDLEPDAYIRNGAIYAIDRDAIVEDGLRYGHADSRPLIMSEAKSVNIDTPLDLRIAQALLDDYPRPRVRELVAEVSDTEPER